jgi:LytS/YehU family sensor histidine kinase
MQNQLGSARSFSKMPQGSKIMRPLLQFESLNLVILIFLDLIILKGKKSHIETENITLRVSNLEAKNQLLLQQLDPHFLFNSLSTLRSLIKRNAVSAEEYLEKLAGILRYSFQNSVKSLIPLTDEIELCRQYLGMQKVRFGNALLFDINVPEGLLTNGEVPVYCVQLLIENAIKHNAFTESMPLFIDITGDVNTATLTIINNLQQKNTLEQSSRIGLANLSARYTALGAPDIEIRQTSETYSVKISVFNYESSNNRR